MSTILVEDRKCLLSRPILQAIADTCAKLGHQVYRWRGPKSGRVWRSRRLKKCDAAFIWNGADEKLLPVVARLEEMKTSIAFVELGWNPQRGTCQIDRQGINANASWANEPLLSTGNTALPVRSEGDLLIALQLDSDTQIKHLSPWFANMRAFIKFVCQNSSLPVRVRPHPKADDPLELQELTESLGGSWDDSPNFATALERSRAVAVINSSVGLEALGHRLPVLCYGLANYRHEGAVYCLDADPAATQAATSQLAGGNCELSLERSQAAYDRVMSHQWRCEEIEHRLPALLNAMLDESPSGQTSTTFWSILGQFFSFQRSQRVNSSAA